MNLILLCLLFPAASLVLFQQEAGFRESQLQRTIKQMRQALENRSAALVRNMALSAGYAAAGYDFTFLNSMVGQVVAEDTEVKYCIIMDMNNRAVAHSEPDKVGSELLSPMDRGAASLLAGVFPANVSEGYRPEVVFFEATTPSLTEHGSIMEARTPIYSGAELFAVLRCGYSLDRFSRQIEATKDDWAQRSRQFNIYLMITTALFFTIGVAMSALFTRAFVRSLQEVGTGVSQVALGDLDHEIRPGGLVSSELQQLSEDFNSMTRQLKITREELDDYSKSLEQKVAARSKELEDAQATLLQQAHEAGMAEMAVGILHNIGNAIIPAKVGIFRLSRRMETKSLLTSVKAALDQLAEIIPSMSTLPPQETERLLGIVKLLPDAIEEEYELNASDVEQIKSKVNHIENIIELQLRYAQLFGDSENVDVSEVVEDALTFLEGATKNRDVRVNKCYSQAPPVKTEKAKLIQIVVNLIKNSYEAMDRDGIAERTLTVSIHHETEPTGSVVLSIKDTGVGLSPQEKQNIFKFGYSTKEKGSGFGLHSCANFLIARKGSISAHSDGHGKGAEFVVRLPVAT